MRTRLTLGTLAAVVIGILFAFNGGESPVVVSVATTPPIQTAAATVTESTPPTRPTSQATLQTAKTIPVATTTPTPNITLSVAGKSYTTFAPTSSTVLDAMQSLSSASDLTFTGRDYPALGFFVDSINGKKAGDGHNWILYVNGKLSNTGASETFLKAGDSVEWKYEKNY